MPGTTVLKGVFDDLRVADVRALETASKDGPVHVVVTDDDLLEESPRFPQAERVYFLESLRWVSRVSLASTAGAGDDVDDGRGAAGSVRGDTATAPAGRVANPPRILVSGCYDWLHTGHVRFFEEAAALGRLFVTVGSDESVAEHKGPGHPLQSQDERLYMVASVRFVEEARIATGAGWLDWVPEVEAIQPDVFVVNEDGDRPEKQAYCAAHGIEYRVLRRLPKEGLPARSSTELRGF